MLYSISWGKTDDQAGKFAGMTGQETTTKKGRQFQPNAEQSFQPENAFVSTVIGPHFHAGGRQWPHLFLAGHLQLLKEVFLFLKQVHVKRA